MVFAIRIIFRMKKKEIENIENYLDLTREKKAAEHENEGDANCSLASGTFSKYLEWFQS